MRPKKKVTVGSSAKLLFDEKTLTRPLPAKLKLFLVLTALATIYLGMIYKESISAMSRSLGVIMLSFSGGARSVPETAGIEDPCGLFGNSVHDEAQDFFDCAGKFLLENETRLRSARDYGLAGGYKATIQRLWYMRRDDLADKIFEQARTKESLNWPSVYWTPTVFFEEADQGSSGLYDCERAWEGDTIPGFTTWVDRDAYDTTAAPKGKDGAPRISSGAAVSGVPSSPSSEVTALTLPRILKEHFSAVKREYMSVPRTMFTPAFSYLDRDGSWEVLWVYRKSKWENEELCAQYLPGLCSLLKQVLPSPESTDYPSVRCRHLGKSETKCRKEMESAPADGALRSLLKARSEALDNTEEVLFLRMEGSARTSPHCGRSNSQVNIHLTLETPESSNSRAMLTVGDADVEQTSGSMYCFNDGARHLAEFSNPDKTGVRTVLVIRVTKFGAKTAAIAPDEASRQAKLGIDVAGGRGGGRGAEASAGGSPARTEL